MIQQATFKASSLELQSINLGGLLIQSPAGVVVDNCLLAALLQPIPDFSRVRVNESYAHGLWTQILLWAKSDKLGRREEFVNSIEEWKLLIEMMAKKCSNERRSVLLALGLVKVAFKKGGLLDMDAAIDSSFHRCVIVSA